MVKAFKIVGFLEGVSYILLFFNMIVIKNVDLGVYKNLLFPIGMTHGMLFIGYIVMAIMLKIELAWSMKKTLLILLASIIPFGTFYSEKNWVHKDIK